jgi:hypothetical protein
MVFDGFFWRRAGHGNGAKRMPKPENEFPEVGFEWIVFFWGCVANTNLAPNILTLNPKFGVRSLAGLES